MGVNKIYLAGPMTGYEDFNRKAFFDNQKKLEKQGFVVVNPATLPLGLEERDYMAICTQMLIACDTIYCLKGWDQSDGAKAEYAMANKLGLYVYGEHNEP